MKKQFKDNNALHIYGTKGNQYGDTMIGGLNAQAINALMEARYFTGEPKQGENLIFLMDYMGHSLYEQKAADQIRISLDDDGKAYVKLIMRQNDPGMGFIALAGGFKDAGETDQQTADREENEEAKSNAGELIATYQLPRRPVAGDIRIWTGPDRDDGIKNGDILALSTMAFVPVVKNAHKSIKAGDDATDAAWVALSELKDANIFGVKTHAKMLLEALNVAGLVEQLPPSFLLSFMDRKADILVQEKTDHTRTISKLLDCKK